MQRDITKNCFSNSCHSKALALLFFYVMSELLTEISMKYQNNVINCPNNYRRNKCMQV